MFKFLNEIDDKAAYQRLSEFEADTKAQAIANLYLASQITSHKTIMEYLISDSYTAKVASSGPFVEDFSVNEANLRKLAYLEA